MSPVSDVHRDAAARKAKLWAIAESWWRLAAFAVLTLVLWWLCANLLHGWSWTSHPVVLSAVSLLPAVLPMTLVFLAVAERERLPFLGLEISRRALAATGAGLLGGASLALGIVGTQYAAGLLVLSSNPPALATGQEAAQAVWEPSAGMLVLVLTLGAAGEELLFRGYGLQQLMRATNVWIGIAGASVLFGVLHLGNPDSSPVGVLNTTLFGLLFGLLLVRSRSLWPSFGVHLGWNITLVAVGTNLSGIRIKVSAVSLVPAGPVLWSGGAYGPEAGLMASIIIVLALAALWRWRPPPDGAPRLWEQP